MAAIEIANVLQAMASFTSANPPVLQRAAGVVSVSRTGVGTFRLVMEEAIPTTLTPPQVQPDAILASAGGAIAAIAVNNGVGGIDITTLDAAGAAVDGGNLVSFKCWRYPNG